MHHVPLPDLAAHFLLGVVNMGKFPLPPPVPVLLVAVDDPLFLKQRRFGELEVEIDSNYDDGDCQEFGHSRIRSINFANLNSAQNTL